MPGRILGFEGEDLRLVVIDHRWWRAAVRPSRRMSWVDGRATIRELIETQSRRRSAATGGESHIPIDGETGVCSGRRRFWPPTTYWDRVRN